MASKNIEREIKTFKNEFIKLIRQNISGQLFIKPIGQKETIMLELNSLWRISPYLFTKIIKEPRIFLPCFFTLIISYKMGQKENKKQNNQEKHPKINLVGPIGRNFLCPFLVKLDSLGEIIALRGKISNMSEKKIKLSKLVLLNREEEKYYIIKESSGIKDILYTLEHGPEKIYKSNSLSVFEEYRWIELEDEISSYEPKRIKILISGNIDIIQFHGDLIEIVGLLVLIKKNFNTQSSSIFETALVGVSINQCHRSIKRVSNPDLFLIENFSMQRNCLDRLANLFKSLEIRNTEFRKIFLLQLAGSSNCKLKDNQIPLNGLKFLFRSSSNYRINKTITSLEDTMLNLKTKIPAFFNNKSLPDRLNFFKNFSLGSTIILFKDFLIINRIDEIAHIWGGDFIFKLIISKNMFEETVKKNYFSNSPSIFGTILELGVLKDKNKTERTMKFIYECFDIVFIDSKLEENFFEYFDARKYLSKNEKTSRSDETSTQVNILDSFYGNSKTKEKFMDFNWETIDNKTIYNSFLGNYFEIINKIQSLTLTYKARETIIKHYTKFKRLLEIKVNYNISKIESIIFLATAHAKCHLRVKVLNQDVKEIESLIVKNLLLHFDKKMGTKGSVSKEVYKNNFIPKTNENVKDIHFRHDQPVQNLDKYPFKSIFPDISFLKTPLGQISRNLFLNSITERIVSNLILNEKCIIFRRIVFLL